MTRNIVVRYRVHPGDADANQQLVENVFAELAQTGPAGLRYATLHLADGSFIHLAEMATEANPLESSPAFAAFTEFLPDRCETLQGPDPQPATVVGNYRLLA